jgi:hypothetical protein
LVGVARLGREVPFPDLSAPALLVIGYAGRNEASVRKHIEELAAIGIAPPPPPQVPMVYDRAADLLTTATHLPTQGSRTSGEVEPVLVRAAGTWHLALGSDHTDRDLEASDVRNSKAACPKPIAPTVILLDVDPVSGGLDVAWDAIEVTSSVDDVAYQRGTLAELRMPSDLTSRATRQNPAGDLVIFCGTVPLLEGAFRYGEKFSATMSAGAEWTLRLEYTMQIGPTAPRGAEN